MKTKSVFRFIYKLIIILTQNIIMFSVTAIGQTGSFLFRKVEDNQSVGFLVRIHCRIWWCDFGVRLLERRWLDFSTFSSKIRPFLCWVFEFILAVNRWEHYLWWRDCRAGTTLSCHKSTMLETQFLAWLLPANNWTLITIQILIGGWQRWLVS